MNQSRLLIKGFALTIVVLSSFTVSSAPASIEKLQNNYHLIKNNPIIIDSSDDHPASVSAFNGRRGFGLTDTPERKVKSLHERNIDLPIVDQDAVPGTGDTIGLPDDYYSDYNTDYSNQLLNPNDYAFLFGIRLTNREDYDDGAGLRYPIA